MNAFLQNFLDWPLLIGSLPSLLCTGLVNTLVLSLFSTVLGIIAGMVLALMAVSHTRWLMLPAQVFVDVFRGLPAALVILLVGQGLAPVGLAIFGPNPYPLAIVALGLISSAYIAEIFRYVIVPQGIRRILPALANQFISIVKDSSLVYFLGLLISQRDLFTIGQNTSVNTANLSPLVAAGVVYLLITVPLTHAINHIDRWTNRHANPQQGGAARGATRGQRKAQASAAETAIAEQRH